MKPDKPIQVRVWDNEAQTATVSSHDRFGSVSDGYHTFDELYRFRMLLQAAWFDELARQDIAKIKLGDGTTKFNVLKSYRHSDGELCFGKDDYFIVVAQLPTGQISNHYKGEYWDLFNVPEVEKAPEWDGHTPEQAADRIEAYLRGKF